MAIDRLAQLAIDIVVNSGRATVQMRNLHSTFRRNTQAINAMNNSFRGAFVGTGIFFSLRQVLMEIAEAIQEVTESFVTLEKSIVDIDKIAKSGNIKKLGQDFIKLTDELGIAKLDEVAKTMQGAARSGLRLGQGLEELTETAVRFAKVSDDISPEDAALGLSRLKINFKLANDEIEKIGASIDALSDSFPVTSGEILKTTARLSGLAQAAGLSAQETAGLSTALLKAGISQTVARTTITRLFTQLQDDPLLVARALKLTEKQFERFAILIKTDAVEGIKEFIRQLNRIGPAAAQDALKELGISSSRLQQALAILKVDLEQVDKAQRVANEAFKEGTNLLEKQFKVIQTGQAQLDQLSNRWEVFKAQLAKSNEVIDTLAGGLTGLEKILGKDDFNVNIRAANSIEDIQSELKKVQQEITKTENSLNFLDGIGNKLHTITNPWRLITRPIQQAKLTGRLERLLEIQSHLADLLRKMADSEKERTEETKKQKENITEQTKQELERLKARKEALIQDVIDKAPRFGRSQLDTRIDSVRNQINSFKDKILEAGIVSKRLADTFKRVNEEGMKEVRRLREEDRREKITKLFDTLQNLSGEFGNVLSDIQQAQQLFNNPLLQRQPGIRAAIGQLFGARFAAIGQQEPPKRQFRDFTQVWRDAQLQVNKKDSQLRQAQLRLARMLIPFIVNHPNHQRNVETLLNRINENLERGGAIVP